MASHSLESHSIRIHPTLWKWAKEDAGPAGYDGGASALIAGLILYNRAIGKRPHWLTADLVNDVKKLEAVITEIEKHNPLENGSTWIEHRLRELAGEKPQPES